MIDLSTLIAMLTAIAAATSSTSPSSDRPPPDPPGQRCEAAPRSSANPTTGTHPDTSSTRSSTATGADEDGGGSIARPLWFAPSADPPESSGTAEPDPNASRSDDRSSPPTGRSRRPESATPTPRSPRPDATDRAGQPDAPTSRTHDPGVEENGAATTTPSREPRPRGTPTDDGSRPPRPEQNVPYPRSGDPACDQETRRSTPAPTDSGVPADLVDLANWYLTLPTGKDGDPDTIEGPRLATYSSAYFRLNESRDGIVLTAPVAGATTPNSAYPRSELREMNGTEEAAWSNGSGRHTLRATEAVTELPESKPELVTAQIHGGKDDVMQIRLEGNHLMVQYADGAKQVTLDPDYRLGTPYDIEIVAATNSISVGYNGEPKAELPLSGNTWYFKAGAYVQSNPTKGDAPTAQGQVVIYSLQVDHR